MENESAVTVDIAIENSAEGSYRLITSDARNLSFETFYKHLNFINATVVDPVTNMTEFDSFLHTLHQPLPVCFR